MPLIYHCFRCNEAGVLNADIMKDVGIYNLSLSSSVKNYNKVALKKMEKRGFTRYTEKFNINLPYPKNIELANDKVKYISSRLGHDFTIDELVLLKVCLNFSDFIKVNELSGVSVSKSILNKIHKNYIGFISSHNDFIQFRDITGKEDRFRYYNYNVYNSIDKSRNFYTIPNKIDLLTNEDINIVLAEGIFDILGVFYNIYDNKLDNMVYSAVVGCGFVSVVKYFLRKGLTGKNIHITIFSDQDKKPEFYTKLYLETIDWVGSITLCYNLKSKDCGVPKEDIEIVQRPIPKLKRRY